MEAETLAGTIPMWRAVGQINIATVIPGRCAASSYGAQLRT
jgi:hypothetical protein